MQRIATSWLVLTLTDSPFYVALAYALYFMPSFVVALFAGTIADQVNRRNLMVAILAVNVAASLVLTAIVMAEVVQLWYILAIVGVIGVGTAFKIPTSQTMAFDVVGAESVVNAISLQSVGMRAVAILGAVTGGALIETVGMGYAFLAATMSYTLGLLLITLMRYRARSRPRSARVANREPRRGTEDIHSLKTACDRLADGDACRVVWTGRVGHVARTGCRRGAGRRTRRAGHNARRYRNRRRNRGDNHSFIQLGRTQRTPDSRRVSVLRLSYDPDWPVQRFRADHCLAMLLRPCAVYFRHHGNRYPAAERARRYARPSDRRLARVRGSGPVRLPASRLPHGVAGRAARRRNRRRAHGGGRAYSDRHRVESAPR